MFKQLELFNPYFYDKWALILRDYLSLKIKIYKWDLEILASMPKRYLVSFCEKLKLPKSGTKAKLLEHIGNFINLANLVQKNFNQNKLVFTLKPKNQQSKIKEIVSIFKPLNIRHSWLNKTGKLKLALTKFLQTFCNLFKFPTADIIIKTGED